MKSLTDLLGTLAVAGLINVVLFGYFAVEHWLPLQIEQKWLKHDICTIRHGSDDARCKQLEERLPPRR